MSQPIRSSYHHELSEFRLNYSKAGLIVSFFLVLMGMGLDYSLYPSVFSTLVMARLLVALLTLVILWTMNSSCGLRWVRPLTLLWLALPQTMIAWMIWTTDGITSVYFMGLHLALYATGIVMPVTFFENLAFGLFTYLLYFLACHFHPSGLHDLSYFIGVSIFILFSVTASSVCTYFNERARMKLFHLQRQVAEKNKALRDTNEALAQVKGHLIQQEKMAALGMLSAGLLHEVNNPVNYSLLALNMAQQEPEVARSFTLKESITDAIEGMRRVQSIVADLKTFAYQTPGDNHGRVFLFEKACRSALRLSGYELTGVDVMLKIPPNTFVLGDEPAVIGVLVNLLSNACTALRQGRLQAPRIDLQAHRKAGRLYITMRDNGVGIKPEHIDRIFEPFFTTQDVGRGLGLGLSVSYSIVQRHGSMLGVSSEMGRWTEFSFDMALADEVNPHD